MATINGRYILVESEDPSYEVDITEQPVEQGINLTDHVQRKPRTMAISGYCVGEEAASTRLLLIAASDNGQIVEYDGRNYFEGLIKGLVTGHTKDVANGFTFSFTLVEVRFGQTSYVETLPVPIRAQAAPVISSGRKQTKTKGNETVEKVKFKPGSPWEE